MVKQPLVSGSSQGEFHVIYRIGMIEIGLRGLMDPIRLHLEGSKYSFPSPSIDCAMSSGKYEGKYREAKIDPSILQPWVTLSRQLRYATVPKSDLELESSSMRRDRHSGLFAAGGAPSQLLVPSVATIDC